MSKIIVMIGQPGAGKGTQARLLSERYHFPQISTGDLLRGMSQEDTPLGCELREILNSGQLVRDEVLIDLVEERTSREDCRNGYIFDGFPRTIAQAQHLDALAKEQSKSIFLIRVDVEEEILLRRVTGRRTCSQCGEIYNIFFHPPQVEGICDRDGAPLKRRGDDTPAAVTLRLSDYRAKTKPVIEYYRKSGRMIEVDGSLPTQDVFERICRSIDGAGVTAT
jgi:adenylate kinase